MTSRVRSSLVGPKPPVVMTRLARPSDSRTASAIASAVSSTATWRETTQPRSASCRQSHCWCVLSTRPSISSLPVLMSSIFTGQESSAVPDRARAAFR
jgi:hypothetical protein